MAVVESGSGNGKSLAVNGRLEAAVFSVSETEGQAATEAGDAYNINTGDISSISSGDASLIYFLNDEQEGIIIESIAIGLRGFTGLSDMATITIVRNPTGGDLITDETAVDMNANRNFGNAQTLKATSVAYKGKNSGTITGGDSIVQIYANNNSRVFTSINLELLRGSSIAIKVDSDATAGTAYAALIIHKKDALRELKQ